jgi:NADPH:quinone reductase-like Zn-dependent oxidoreductase
VKAAVCTAYGSPDVVRILDVPAPTAAAGEVLIRIHATTVSSGDARIRGARFPAGFALPARLALGLTKPRSSILGTELAGVVESVGDGVTRFRPGDRVFGFPGIGMGCHAELKAMPETGAIAAIPDGVSFEEAAAISFGGTTALYFLRDVANVKPAERVLINGASGAVGTAAVQLARHFGAHVTGVCSAGNAALIRSLGADEVIDHRAADFARIGERWDVILDTVGNASLPRCRLALAEEGRLLLLVAGLGQLLAAPLQSRTSGFKVAAGPAPERPQDIAELRALCAAGVYKPVIDSRFPLDAITRAHARADSGRKVGSVVITLP